MERNRILYQRIAVFNDTMEISIPMVFTRSELSGHKEHDEKSVLWTDKKESISLHMLEENQHSLKDIILVARSQLKTEKTELKNLGMYSSKNYDIEKYMSEDELILEGVNLYIISCAFRYDDMSYMLYYTGDTNIKTFIKEKMLYILDSIRFNKEVGR